MENNTTQLSDMQKTELINSCKTLEELKDAIAKVADEDGCIQGSRYCWPATQQQESVDKINMNRADYTRLTRTFGIRQKMIDILAGE